MFLKTLLLTVFFVAIAGLAMALKYFNEKKAPSCSNMPNSENGDDCIVCGAQNMEDCEVESDKENLK